MNIIDFSLFSYMNELYYGKNKERDAMSYPLRHQPASTKSRFYANNANNFSPRRVK